MPFGSSAPRRARVYGASTALLIVDMQNAYFEDRNLSAEQPRLVAECNRLIRGARAAGVSVINARTEDLRDKSTWTVSMIDEDQGYLFHGTDQVRCVPGLEVADAAEVIKLRDSAFAGTDLLLRLRTANTSRLILAGVSTHTCISQTASEAYAQNFHVVLARDAIASHRPEYEEQVLSVLHNEYRQHILHTPDVLALLAAR